MRLAGRRLVLGIVGCVGVLGVAQVLVATNVISYTSVVTPTAALGAMFRSLVDGDLLTSTAQTVRSFFIASLIGVTIGIALGVVIGLLPMSDQLFSPTVDFLRFLPPVAMIPVVLLVYGFEPRSSVVLGIWAAVWPLVVAAASGVRQVERRLIDVGRSMRLGAGRTALKLVLPAAAPTLATGIRLALAFCFISVVTMEIIAVPSGLGYQLTRAGNTLQYDLMWGYLIWIGLLGIVVNGIVQWLQRLLLRWHPSQRA
jgi:ABC-type nitrate/sulfonate/bicarbonate transport system permease component